MNSSRWIFVEFNTIENVWVRDVTSQFFGYACVGLHAGTRYATVTVCKSLDPPMKTMADGRAVACHLHS